jgi:hypothetical protein
MTKVYSVTADRERPSGVLAWLQAPDAAPSFFYAVWEREFLEGLLVSERMAAAGAGYLSRAEALQDGLKVRDGLENPTAEQVADRWHAANDDRALSLQVRGNRLDPHCIGAYE